MAGSRKVKMPTPAEDEAIARGIVADEDAWEPTDAEFATLKPAPEVLQQMGVSVPRPRGRPRKAQPKEQVSIRLDADVLAALRATGKGWQTRVNAILRQWLAEHADQESS